MSHLFRQTHADLGTQGENASKQRDTQTASTALLITAGEENIALF